MADGRETLPESPRRWRPGRGERRQGRSGTLRPACPPVSFSGATRSIPPVFAPCRMRPILLYCLGDAGLLRGPRHCGGRRTQGLGAGLPGWPPIWPVVFQPAASASFRAWRKGSMPARMAQPLQEVGRSIGVLGTGIDRVYPQRNAALFDPHAGGGRTPPVRIRSRHAAAARKFS